jgi:hypothetical protein
MNGIKVNWIVYFLMKTGLWNSGSNKWGNTAHCVTVLGKKLSCKTWDTIMTALGFQIIRSRETYLLCSVVHLPVYTYWLPLIKCETKLYAQQPVTTDISLKNQKEHFAKYLLHIHICRKQFVWFLEECLIFTYADFK